VIHRGPARLPAIASVARPLSAAADRLLAGVLRRWRTGAIEVALPEGRILRGGEEGAAAARLEIRDRHFVARLLLRGELGAGESYVAGEWDSPDLVCLLRGFLRNLDALAIDDGLSRVARWPARIRHRLRDNSRRGSRSNVRAHYDLGNDLYALFLDPSWSYSCALWQGGARTLEEAQQAKLERLGDWLDLGPADHLLEIGCGWGGLAMWAARSRGCRVTGITLSREQLELARRRVAEAGLADRIELRLADYRELEGRFDKIVSIEMIEAVGDRHLPGFFATCAARLAPGGAMALQSILMPEHKVARYRRGIDWTQIYIFPGSFIPSLGTLSRAWSGAGFALERFEDIGPDYAPTAAAWRARLLGAADRLRPLGFDERFLRTWNLYLAFSEAAFAERSLGDGQLLLRRI
jgi:cyclopropane-fatty-acyl-phospholipid synthase